MPDEPWDKPETIIDEAYKVGRDVEAHADDQHAHPTNWDAVCEYAAARLACLVEALRECMSL